MAMRRYGERFMFGFDGKAVTGLVEEMIIERRISGVILFSRNVTDAMQVTGLCNDLQGLRRSVSELPLIIAIDQEGGVVNRIGKGVTHFPSPMAVAAAGSVEFADRIGYCIGCQLLSLGINMNLAPVLDVNSNRNNPIIGVRSFGDVPETVAAYGAAMINGLQRAGVASVAKHFPGLGFADRDAHLETPVIAKDTAELEKDDLLPFRSAVAACVAGIMVGHARYPSLSARPASLSKTIIGELLKEGMHFGGIVITDDLEMGSVSINRDPGDAAVKACGAGADLLLVCHSPAGQISAQGAIARAVTSGKLRSENIKGSLERIRALKEKIREWGEAAGSQEPEDGDALAREVAEAAITLAGDPNKILPLRVGGGEKLLVLAPAMGPLSRAEEGGSHDDALSSLIRERRPEASVIQYEIIPSKENLASVREGLDGADVVIMGTCNAHFYSEQEELIREVATSGKSSVFAALRDPYDLELFPGASARVAAYGADPHTTAALIKVLFGDIPARGKLPVALSM